MDLAIHKQRINDIAAVVHRNIALDFHLACVTVDFRNHDVRSKGERKVGRLPEVCCHETGLGVGRKLHGAVGRGGDLRELDGFTRLVADALAAGASDIVGLQQHLAELLDLGLQILQRIVKRGATDRC